MTSGGLFPALDRAATRLLARAKPFVVQAVPTAKSVVESGRLVAKTYRHTAVDLAKTDMRALLSELRAKANKNTLSSAFKSPDSDPLLSVRLYHLANNVLLVGTPIAFLLGGTSLKMPFEIALGFALPLHGHIGMNYVITDYVKKYFGAARVAPARSVMFGVTVFTMLGMLKLNLFGPGLVTSFTSTFRNKWVALGMTPEEGAALAAKVAAEEEARRAHEAKRQNDVSRWAAEKATREAARAYAAK